MNDEQQKALERVQAWIDTGILVDSSVAQIVVDALGETQTALEQAQEKEERCRVTIHAAKEETLESAIRRKLHDKEVAEEELDQAQSNQLQREVQLKKALDDLAAEKALREQAQRERDEALAEARRRDNFASELAQALKELDELQAKLTTSNGALAVIDLQRMEKTKEAHGLIKERDELRVLLENHRQQYANKELDIIALRKERDELHAKLLASEAK